MIKVHHLAVLLSVGCLAGCIVLPPPMLPMYFHPPAYGPVAAYDDEAPPLPPLPVWDICEGQAEGARPVLPGPRGDMLWGTCRRGPSGALEFRPSDGR
jgi:hypothetical protein